MCVCVRARACVCVGLIIDKLSILVTPPCDEIVFLFSVFGYCVTYDGHHIKITQLVLRHFSYFFPLTAAIFFYILDTYFFLGVHFGLLIVYVFHIWTTNLSLSLSPSFSPWLLFFFPHRWANVLPSSAKRNMENIKVYCNKKKRNKQFKRGSLWINPQPLPSVCFIHIPEFLVRLFHFWFFPSIYVLRELAFVYLWLRLWPDVAATAAAFIHRLCINKINQNPKKKTTTSNSFYSFKFKSVYFN